MSQSEKSAYFQALKAAGVSFEKHYREYTTEYLKASYERLVDEGVITPIVVPEPEPAPTFQDAFEQAGGVDPYAEAGPSPEQQPPVDLEAASFFGFEAEQPPAAAPTPAGGTLPQSVPVRPADPQEMAGQRLNTSEEEVPLRIDPDTGRAWFQEEVRKPAYPKPRGRRVLRYMDPGVQQKTVTNGQFTETFEIPGDPANARPAEVKITLPSYQVGKYRDPRFPFMVITYNGNEGFDLFEVQKYYGGAELVPADVKRKYVENVLCYDIRTTVRAIQTEFRQLQLAGKV